MPRHPAAFVGLVLLILAIAYVGWTVHVAGTNPDGMGTLIHGWKPILALVVGVAGLVLTYRFWMRSAWFITLKELRTYFTSPVPYAVGMAVFGINGFIYWLILTQWIESGQAQDVGMTLMTLTFLLLLISPLVTMRLFAEEKRTGTYEMLMTRPLHDVHVVVGKFVGAVCVFGAILAGTLVLPIIVELGADPGPDWGPVWSAYVGLFGWCMAFTAIGLFCSALTSSQIAAAALAWFLLLVLWLLSILREVAPGKLISKVGDYLSPRGTMMDFCQGTINTTHCVYLLSVTVFFLFGAWMALYASRSK